MGGCFANSLEIKLTDRREVFLFYIWQFQRLFVYLQCKYISYGDTGRNSYSDSLPGLLLLQVCTGNTVGVGGFPITYLHNNTGNNFSHSMDIR